MKMGMHFSSDLLSEQHIREKKLCILASFPRNLLSQQVETVIVIIFSKHFQ